MVGISFLVTADVGLIMFDKSFLGEKPFVVFVENFDSLFNLSRAASSVKVPPSVAFRVARSRK